MNRRETTQEAQILTKLNFLYYHTPDNKAREQYRGMIEERASLFKRISGHYFTTKYETFK